MSSVYATHWKSSQLMSNRSYEINFYRDKDFKTVSIHSHDFYELYFFIRGEATYIVENGHYRLQSGDTLLISPTNLHQLDVYDSSETYERIVLWLNPRYLKRLSTSKTDLSECFRLCSDNRNHLIRDNDVSEDIKANLLAVYSLSQSAEFGDDVAAEIHIKHILLTLCKYLKLASAEPAARSVPSQPDNVISRALDFISKHISDNLSLDNLADSLFISKYYLSRLFKEQTGTTPHQYILKKRLILSKRLIEEELPINEVFSRCGFCDYTHFFRAFKQEYGITPKQYFGLINRS